jgi:hypothetical protein
MPAGHWLAFYTMADLASRSTAIMNRFARFILLFVVIAALVLALPGPVYAQSPSGNDSPVIFGSDYVLSSGQTIKDLVVFGGNATLEGDSTVTGDVVIFGGNLVVAGEVKGDVTTFGGNITVADNATVGGNLNTLGGAAQISSKAHIKGNRVSGVGALPLRVPTQIYTPGFWVDFGPGAGYVSAVFGALILALIAVLIALFLPAPTDRIAQTIGTQPIISGAIGLLTLVVTPALFLVLVITVILIPLGLLGLLIFAIAVLFGWVALGLELGKRMTGLFRSQWAIPVSAGVGTLVLSLLTNIALVVTGYSFWTLCCVGFPLLALLMMVGLGGVVTSRFGATVYSPNARPAQPLPPAYPPYPAPQPPMPPQGQPPMPPVPPMDWSRPVPPAPEQPQPPQPEQPSEPPQPQIPPQEPHDPSI